MIYKSNKKRTFVIFAVSLIVTLATLYIGNGVKKYIIHQRMIAYSMSSFRKSDGAANRVVLNGISGNLGYTSVYLKYLKDGWISLTGDNITESNGWKLLSEFTLEPGLYTLTGMCGVKEKTVALQLYFRNDTGFYRYIYQYDRDIRFTVERPSKAVLHVRVYPNVKEVDSMVHPAVYRDE